ncbi:O-methyltransferase [Paenibacillus guangzhouensis]|uniref:O-methyltransferase n=1 Tax=Paenibacillus guangzhouensis TaxID=1473112 RepID=UPI001266BA22|nr:class I SAM-dependent methyltransferase [Paenibacillus guangzhouensis]
MEDHTNIHLPIATSILIQKAAEVGFTASCDVLTGSFLRMLAASQQHANILELGTGVGFSTAWILEGMDRESRLTTVEMDEACAAIAREILGVDPRATFVTMDGGQFIEQHAKEQYHVIFADTWPGKFYLIEEVLNMVAPGGLYIIEDLNPQPNWPEGHGAKVEELIAYLETRDDFFMSKMNWSTGLILMTRKHG